MEFILTRQVQLPIGHPISSLLPLAPAEPVEENFVMIRQVQLPIDHPISSLLPLPPAEPAAAAPDVI